MSAPRWVSGGFLLWLLLSSTGARAQDGEELARRGRTAYQALDYDMAAALFRRALGARGSEVLPDSSRASTYMYLGATELFRARRAAADSAFLRALAADPSYRPDQLIFPPEVTDLFRAARYDSRYVKVVPPPDTTILVGEPSYVLRLYASARHDISVEVLQENGRVARSLYTGPVGDSMSVRWDGSIDDDGGPGSGTYVVQVASMTNTGRGRIVRLPLTVRAITQDTLVPPPPPDDAQLLREHSSPAPAIGALAVGVAGGIAAIALPAIVNDAPEGPGRFVVGASLGLSGIVGFILRRPGRAITDNIAANREEREAWQDAVEEIRAENAVRRRVRLHITAGEPRVIDEETP